MLTEDQEHLIEATAPVVAEHLNTITTRFYPILFTRYPEVRALFNDSHQASGDQARALAAGVLRYVGLRKQPAAAREAMAIAISKHVSLGIQPEHYPMVGECLMAAIGEVLGEAITPEIADAWTALYNELAAFLIDAEHRCYQEFAARPGGWQGLRRFRVVRRRPESALITSFELEPVDGGAVADFLPGQYIGVRLKIDGEPVYRHYSLSDLPDGQRYRISVKREQEGRASRFLHEQALEGFELELLPPAGDLTLQGDEPLLLISGGVGQTPLLPMARQAVSEGRSVVYVHAARSPEHHAFREELDSLKGSHPDRFRSVVVYESAPEPDTADYVGRVSQTILEACLPAENARCYFVGPQGFMSAVNSALEALGIPEARRHHEHFGPSAVLA